MLFSKPTPPAALEPLKRRRPLFTSTDLGKPPLKYVAWIDLMGTGSIMTRSMPTTANFIGKLHAAAVRSKPEQANTTGMHLYPVVDGLYATTPHKSMLLSFVKNLFISLAATFIYEVKPYHHFVVRAGIAYGPVWEGRNLVAHADDALRTAEDYAEAILLGPPVVAAYNAEKEAAPFGIWVDSSARAFGPRGTTIPFTHLRWWEGEDVPPELIPSLASHLACFYKWCRENSHELLYGEERVKLHEALAREYFGTHLWCATSDESTAIANAVTREPEADQVPSS